MADASSHNRYGSVAGSAAARAAAAGYFDRRGVPTTPDQVVFGPGSKALLYALIAGVPGEVILPQPSWVSYVAQAALTGKEVVRVPVPDAVGGVPDPEELVSVLARRGRGVGGVLVLTLPDNPTGTLASGDPLGQVCALAEEFGVLVVADEIYRDLSFAPASFTSPVDLIPMGCVVTTRLSKSMALGGWRVGFARFPDNAAGREAFGDDPAALRFRVATSLLYGRTDDERWAALRSADPVALPWIADALATLRATLDALSSL